MGQASVYEAGDQRPHPPKNSDNMDDFAAKFAAGNTPNTHNKDDPSTFLLSPLRSRIHHPSILRCAMKHHPTSTTSSITQNLDPPARSLNLRNSKLQKNQRANQWTITEDERSIANRLELEANRTDEDAPKTEEEAANKIDATLPARLHGNEPSKGAKIDQEIRDEEEEEIRKKDEAKAQAAAAKK